MVINKNENISYFDVDNTLVKWLKSDDRFIQDEADPGVWTFDPDIKMLDFYGMPKFCKEIRVHTEFLKSLKARGHYIIVHSGNGWQWAKTVVEALNLKDYVDEIKTKGCKYIDDDKPENWINRVYLGDE